jgi:formylglycine-generating enzyme required for sulfatase activity
VAVCHNGWTSNEAGELTEQYYLIEVHTSAFDGAGKSDHQHHHAEQEDGWGNMVNPADDYGCFGDGYAVEDGVCQLDGVDQPCEKDSDGDGVWDSADACPDTPKGVEVGSDGCEPSTCAPSSATGMEVTLIEAGTFEVGSTAGSSDEAPVHTVEITQDFCLGTYEVTQAEWQEVMRSNPSYFSETGGGSACDGDCPVESVSWNDVQAFITALNDREGTTAYRLPTEAEWEYAARAGTTTEWSWGSSDAVAGDYAWYASNSGSTTHAVGGKLANPWGLYDVHGNVWEWVQDWYDSGYYITSPSTDPTGPASGSFRVWRGGSWLNAASNLRSANRDRYTPGDRFNFLGFRLLRAGS